MLDFLKDWTIPDFQRLNARDIRDWCNKWLSMHLKNAYKEYIEAEIDECHAEAKCFDSEIDNAVKQGEAAREDALDYTIGTGFKDSRQLADLMARTADGKNDVEPTATPVTEQVEPGLQLSVLATIKDHLCAKLYGLNDSVLSDWEKRLAYCLLGHLLKQTNVLLEKYGSENAKLEFDQALKQLVSELESESLSPFESRRG